MTPAFLAPREVYERLGIGKSLFFRLQARGDYRHLLHPNGRGHKKYSAAKVEAYCAGRRRQQITKGVGAWRSL